PYTMLTLVQFGAWLAFVATLGRLPLPGLAALLFAMGLVGGAFVLTWPMGREVNPPELAGIAVAAVNLGGFVGTALTQGPLAAGARVYPVEAYRATFLACAGLVLCASVTSLFFRETGARNVWTARR